MDLTALKQLIDKALDQLAADYGGHLFIGLAIQAVRRVVDDTNLLDVLLSLLLAEFSIAPKS